MKQKSLLAVSIILVSAIGALAQGTAFTYQGRLVDNGSPANGNYDLRFYVYDALTGGSIVAGPITNAPVAVSNGLFTVRLDFGAGVFTGPQRWLHIGARSNGVAVAYTALSPRQELTPTPYAITAENLDGTLSASQLTGTLPGGLLSGTYPNAVTFNNAADSFTGNGSGLTGLNGSGLSSGTVPDARLSANVALLNRSPQTFTGTNIFFRGPGAPGLIVNGFNAVDTELFTGLGFQYYTGTGEGAIMSAYNDGFASLSFYTKPAFGAPITKQMIIDNYGNVAIDQNNVNNGAINNGQTNGAGLTFGVGSGEGIASKRTAGGNQYGLDFYTGFTPRLSLSNGGNLSFLDPSQTLVFPATSGANNPMIEMFSAGTGNADRMVIAHSPNFPNWGLQYQDVGDKFNFLSGGSPVLTVNLSAENVGILTSSPGQALDVNGEFAVVRGLGNEQAYIGGDGFGNDVQVGSLNPNVMAVAFYNAASNAYMHIYCSSITINGGADLAEPFEISSGNNDVPQGSVVVIDDENPGHLKVSDRAYDTRVAGVISGANGVNPGIQMRQQDLLEGGKNVALTGRIYVQADASGGPIRPGDLLTTSSTPGYAMKVLDHAKAQGAILGKAMTALKEGKGMVLVLVSLQ